MPDVSKQLLHRGLVELAVGRPTEAVALWQQIPADAPEYDAAEDYIHTVRATASPETEPVFTVSGANDSIEELLLEEDALEQDASVSISSDDDGDNGKP